MEREDLCGRALKLETMLIDALAPLVEHELVEEVRGGVGVLAAVNLRQDLIADDATLAATVATACREAGMLIRPLVGGALAVSPPLVIEDAEVSMIADAFRAGLDAAATT
jgi:putrescine---pyruvate transaminase